MLPLPRWRPLIDDYRLRQMKHLIEVYGVESILEYEGQGYTAEDHEQLAPEQEMIIKSLDRSFNRIKNKLHE